MMSMLVISISCQMPFLAEAANESRKPVALVLSESLFDDRQELPQRSYYLTQTIVDRLRDEFCHQHSCEPSEDEVRSFQRHAGGIIALIMRQSYPLDLAKKYARIWRFEKSLYEIYGGKVTHQTAGFLPVGAYRAWLTEQERNGTLKLLDPTLHAQFWKQDLVRDLAYDPLTVEVTDGFLKVLGWKDPYEKPWWKINWFILYYAIRKGK